MNDPRRFDTLHPAFHVDPYPLYHEVRERFPIFWSDPESAWVVTRYAGLAAALADPLLLNGEPGQRIRRIAAGLGETLEDLARLLDMTLFFRNPPGHAPARQFMARVLALRPLNDYASVIDGIAGRLIQPLRRNGGMDLIADFAEPLPPLFMGWLFGLGDEDTRFLAATLSGVPAAMDRARPMRVYRDQNRRIGTAYELLRRHIAERRRTPREDGLSLMVRLNHEAERPLDDDRLAATACFLFLAGFETTTALIGSGLWLPLRHPEWLPRIAAEPSLLGGAVEEALRLEPPIQQVPRYAAEALSVQGQAVRAGQRVLLLLGSANRDPRVYAEPDRFRPDRQAPPPLSFGAGAHACLGAGLAKLEARIALSKLLEQPALELAGGPPEWRPSQNQRRLQRLPVVLGAGRVQAEISNQA